MNNFTTLIKYANHFHFLRRVISFSLLSSRKEYFLYFSPCYFRSDCKPDRLLLKSFYEPYDQVGHSDRPQNIGCENKTCYFLMPIYERAKNVIVNVISYRLQWKRVMRVNACQTINITPSIVNDQQILVLLAAAPTETFI